MKTIVWGFIFVLLIASCKNNKTSDPVALEMTDSLEKTSDSLESDSILNPPKAADGLFDDFIYSYMRIPRFQLERTVFPLPNIIDGKKQTIEKSDWIFDHLYVKQDVYTVIFDNTKSMKAEKDTSLHHVVVEWVYLNKKRVKQYVFDKLDGQWKLTSLQQHGFSENVNNDFYVFYSRFSTDKRYQMSHISNPFHFKTYDFDQFQNIEGLLDVNQWPDYRPNLPSGTITNINYGQTYGNKNRRVLVVCSQSGGMGCSLTFVRKGKSWMLERLEN